MQSDPIVAAATFHTFLIFYLFFDSIFHLTSRQTRVIGISIGIPS